MIPLLSTASAWASPPAEVIIHQVAPPIDWVEPEGDEAETGLSFLGLAQVKASASDITTTNPLLDGQVVGLLGGTNGTTIEAEGPAALFVEQRGLGFFSYAPPVLDARAALTAGFEIDFSWGDRSYGTGGNAGGGYGADQVNLQTRRLYVSLSPLDGPQHRLTVHVGLQFVADGVADPMSSRPDDVLRAGGRLLFFGSEASGIAGYGRIRTDWGDRLAYRLGTFTLHEQGLGVPDDVSLHVADVAFRPAPSLSVGAHAWMLRDRADSQVGQLGAGVTSALAEMQGANRLDLRVGGEGLAPIVATDLWYLALDAGYNHALADGPLGLSGVAALNTGYLLVTDLPDRDVSSALVDVEARARWAPGDGSVLRAELLWTSADDEGDSLNSVVTGNTYGLVGAVHATHGTLLLFADPFSINRHLGVVYDVSNQGDGLLALTGGAAYDLVPGRVNAAIGAGHARGSAGPVGTELNGRLVAETELFLKLGLHGGVVLGTDHPRAPWIVYSSLDWVVF